METRHGLVARGDGETTQGDSEMDVVAKVPVTSSPAAEKVEEQSDIRTRILASFQEVDKNSDRDDASSVRSRESLDLLGDDLDPTSNMGGSQKDLHMLASSEDVVESEPGSKLPGVSLCAHPSEVTLADCQGDPPPPLHLVGEPLRLEAQCAVAPGDQTADHMMSHEQHEAGAVAQGMAVVEVVSPKEEGKEDPLPSKEDNVELQGSEGITALEVLVDPVEASPHAVGEKTALVVGIKANYEVGKECVSRTYWPGRVVSPDMGIIELTFDGFLGQAVQYPPLFSRWCRKGAMDEEMV